MKRIVGNDKARIKRFVKKRGKYSKKLKSYCWIWEGSKGPQGYGMFYYTVKGIPKQTLAHRYIYELLVSPIPNGLEIDHLCFNRKCVNPKHLEPVTKAVNLKREFARITHCPRGHEYRGENLITNEKGHRWCRMCVKIRNREGYLRRKSV